MDIFSIQQLPVEKHISQSQLSSDSKKPIKPTPRNTASSRLVTLGIESNKNLSLAKQETLNMFAGSPNDKSQQALASLE